ncbi:hypothetical protein [Escherichia albertii]|uniref:hypothetical protein n=1 Tax=Escherichia albertii TaxID=208962 RepID=UPI00237A5D46|nr:hypothetical protein [Escherichia albertii]MDD9748616.1 hypothetical protein [Escherichia albertii]
MRASIISPLAIPNKTVFKHQKTLVQDRRKSMIESLFCEQADKSDRETDLTLMPELLRFYIQC